MAWGQYPATSGRGAWLSLPQQPSPRRPSPARLVGGVALGVGAAALAGAVLCRLIERPTAAPAAAAGPDPSRLAAARRLDGAAAILAFSVLADSSIEHYRGGFHNPGMYVAPAIATASLANSLQRVLRPRQRGTGGIGLCGLAFAAGLGGVGFHVFNLAKRPGGIDLPNLFYGAPLGAPAAIALSGACGLAAAGLTGRQGGTWFGRPAGPVVALGAATALIGTVLEAALLHFRGAFHDPFMFVPVTLPPAAAAVLAAAACRPRWSGLARLMLRLTALVGLAGVGFHLYGVQRNMGGFYNWSQNLLNGPPVPAPPAFTGAALAGLAALRLMEPA